MRRWSNKTLLMAGLAGLFVLAGLVFALRSLPSTESDSVSVNYEDPNMAVTDNYVAEASAACVKANTDSGGQVTPCMRELTSRGSR